MSVRHRVADRRQLETSCFRFDNHGYTIGLGREVECIERDYPLGPVVEIFLNAEKVDSMADAISSDMAILISKLLQHGCSAAEIAKSLKRNAAGVPATLIGHVADLILSAP